MQPAENGAREFLRAGAAFLTVFLVAQFVHDRIVDPDGYFHVVQARRVLADRMPNLPLSIFGRDGWVDHQLGHHLLLAPFAWLLSGVLAAKVSAAVFAAAALLALRRTLQRLGVPHAGWAALVPVALSWTLLVRLEMPRTQALSLMLLALSISAIVEGRHRGLFALSWAFAWTYQLSLLLLPIALLWWALARLPLPGPRPARPSAAPVAAALGLLAGLTLHPHSPGTLRFLWQHVVLKVWNRDGLPVGTEWTVGGFAALLTQAGAGLLLLVAALALVVGAWVAGRRPDRATVFVVALATGATGATLFATKFLEYGIPLSAAAAALAAARAWPARRLSPRWQAGIGVILCLALTGQILRARTAILREEPDPQRLAAVMEFARGHVPPGDRIYHFSWNDFPELVFHAPQYEYIVGLDPHFLALARPDLWELHEKIGRGWGSNPSKPIRQQFGARWAILVLPYPGEPRRLLTADPGLALLYEDAHALLFSVGEAM